MTTVGIRLVEGLIARGIDTVFGIPGVHTIELYRGLAAAGDKIRHVTPRHEQGAGFMADGYARVAGKPAAAFVITGPGLTNTITAMAQARADSVPMLVVSGLGRSDTLGKGLGRLHELPDQGAMIATLCHTETVTDPKKLGEVLDRAFAAMTSGRPGPAHIQISTNMMGQPCPALPPPVVAAAAVPLPMGRMRSIANALNNAERIVILAGGGTRGAHDELRKLAEMLDAPVVLTANARGALHGHRLCVPASPSLNSVRKLIAEADQVLAVGTEIGPTDYDVYAKGGVPDLSGMIRIDICADQLGRHPAKMPIKADAGPMMAALLGMILPANRDGARRAATTRDAARAELATLGDQLPMQLEMVEAIRAAMPGATIVGDSTQPVYAANLYYDHDRPGGWFNAATGYGALGFGPGAAVGAALAAPGTPVVCLIGDGGLQFSPGELRTAVDEKLPITYIVWNNAGFREIADTMRQYKVPEIIGCDPSPLDMQHFAMACDMLFAAVPPDPEELAEMLATPHDGPRFLEIQVR
ncbi:5-guanidino-2-oxopentanoate decarboxylase [Paracoccus sp. (in: a-proteobacteria)]|jgi:acetolactate synthase-1/2/3 large subunit|uniref:5-guanidino-2-oxopentanoate decarboxylase n=1 Tax=Paracoccus sp. TaxID=267 RepID=UPI00272A8823|nr:5-guanidino-2-oxopentanoate decarboxylase [Paracoccus sp. (in: a-proteobacteria)]